MMLIETDAPPTPGRESIDGAALVEAHLPDIDRALAIVSRQWRLSKDEAQELASDTYLRLLRHDAAVLRRYRGDSSLGTFLVVVIQRMLLDARIARDGKWRPSAGAKRLGRVAVLLERLVSRDRLPFGEAATIVREKLKVSDTDDELLFLLALLPTRHRRPVESDAALHQLAAPGPDAERALLQAVDRAERQRIVAAVFRLPEEDRRLIGLRFVRGLRLREIARIRQIDEKRIYRRFEKTLWKLRLAISADTTARRHLPWHSQVRDRS